MHSHSLDHWKHTHSFLGQQHSRNARRTWAVVVLTTIMMIVEIVGGSIFGSMALLADGWHMATHAAALGISGLAYLSAWRHASDPRFTFGTGKFGDLAAFASAIILGLIAIQIGYESAVRFINPVPISYGEAIAIAALGLGVNLFSAWLLRDQHGHGHDHGHVHDHERDHPHDHHRDNNLRAAYLHVLADAATSVLAIVALLAALFWQWTWIDPAVGIIGGLLIGSWSYGLIKGSGAVLLDMASNKDVESAIRNRLETEGDRVTDLHLWQIGPGHRAAVVSIVSDHPSSASVYKSRLADVPGLSHVTVEVEQCASHLSAVSN